MVDVFIRFISLLGYVWNASFGLLFCFKMRICCHYTVRNHKALLDYVVTSKWGTHGDNFI